MFDAELDIALVVDAAGVGELVRLEPHQGRGLAGAVLELPHDLGVQGAALAVDEVLITPPEAVPHGAARHVHPVDVLIIDADHEGQRVSNLDILGHESLWRLPEEDPHAWGRHGGRGCQGCGAQSAETRNFIFHATKKTFLSGQYTASR